eukprot:m.42889 g.42889  ORF g.42889 m.42889 type:complete len:71 (+) comp10743_c0_seq2:246-458(+)
MPCKSTEVNATPTHTQLNDTHETTDSSLVQASESHEFSTSSQRHLPCLYDMSFLHLLDSQSIRVNNTHLR